MNGATLSGNEPGTSKKGVNMIYRQLIQNLINPGTRPFVIRVGGSTTDYHDLSSDRRRHAVCRISEGASCSLYAGRKSGH